MPFAALEDADIIFLDAPVQMVVPFDLGKVFKGAPPKAVAVSKRVARKMAARKFGLDQQLAHHLSVEEIRALRAHLRRQDDRVEMKERESSTSGSRSSSGSSRRESTSQSGGGRRRRLSGRRGAGLNLWTSVGAAVQQVFPGAPPGERRDLHGRRNAAAVSGAGGGDARPARLSRATSRSRSGWFWGRSSDDWASGEQGGTDSGTPSSSPSTSRPSTPRTTLTSPRKSRSDSLDMRTFVNLGTGPVVGDVGRSVSGGGGTSGGHSFMKRASLVGRTEPQRWETVAGGQPAAVEESGHEASVHVSSA
jgi:hypothetical protein